MFEETPDYHAHYFDEALGHGFGGFKVRLGRSVADDVATVAAVRDHVGPDALIGVDSYWFHDARTALEVAERAAPARHRVLRGAGAADARRRPRLAGGPQPDPDRRRRAGLLARPVRRPRPAPARPTCSSPTPSICGGMLACMEIAALARQRGIAVYPHVGGPTIIGLAANLHWAVAADVRLDGVRHRPVPAAGRRGRRPAIGLGDIVGGELAAPDGPGLGVSPARRRRRALPVRPRRHLRRGVPRPRERAVEGVTT